MEKTSNNAKPKPLIMIINSKLVNKLINKIDYIQ